MEMRNYKLEQMLHKRKEINVINVKKMLKI